MVSGTTCYWVVKNRLTFKDALRTCQAQANTHAASLVLMKTKAVEAALLTLQKYAILESGINPFLKLNIPVDRDFNL